jgi:hypothetical protein
VDLATRTLARPATAAILILVALVTRIVLSVRVPTPWVLMDEILYSDLAKSLADGSGFRIRGAPSSLYNFLYPFLIAPAWLTHEMSRTYVLAKAINVVLMVAAAAVTYVWARRLVSPAAATAALLLVLAMPAYVYTTTLLTENAFFPAVVLACFAIAAALERPTLLRQAAALAAIGLALAVRAQGVILALVLATALLLKALLDARAAPPKERLRAALAPAVKAAPSLAVLVLAAGTYEAANIARGRSLRTGLGSYGGLTTANYDVGSVAHWFVLHLAEFGLATAILPAGALLGLLAIGVWYGLADVRERAFIAVALSAVFWFALQSAAYASQFVPRIEERYMFHVAPLAFLALVVWLDRPLPRPRPLLAAAALLPVLLLLRLPLGSLLNISILSDTFGLIPFLRMTKFFDGNIESVRWLMLAGGLAAAVGFALLPRRLMLPASVLAVGTFLILSSWVVFGAIRDYARGIQANTYGGTPASWIDDAIGPDAHAAYLFTPGPDPGGPSTLLWETEFWNRSLGSVYNLGIPEAGGGASERAASIDSRTGKIVPAVPGSSPRYVIADVSFPLDGKRVAVGGSLALYRVAGQLRLAQSIQGVYADGWMGSDASFTRYAPLRGRGGRVVISISRRAWRGASPRGQVQVQLLRRGNVREVRRWAIRSGAQRIFSFHAPPPPFEVRIHVTRTFSPAEHGGTDTRQLGAQVGFRVSTGSRGA